MTELLAKTEDEKKLEDEEETWAVLTDKGFEGLGELVRLISPFKKPKNRVLSREEEDMNSKIGSVRVVCENYYGRMKGKFKIVGERYGLEKENFKRVFGVCVCLTNFDIQCRPLRKDRHEIADEFL